MNSLNLALPSYKSWVSLWASLRSVSSNLHRFKWAFAQLIFTGVELCWLIFCEIQIILLSKLKQKMKSYLGSLSCTCENFIFAGPRCFFGIANVSKINYFFKKNHSSYQLGEEILSLLKYESKFAGISEIGPDSKLIQKLFQKSQNISEYLVKSQNISKYLVKSQNILRNLEISWKISRYFNINCEIPYSQKSHNVQKKSKKISFTRSQYLWKIIFVWCFGVSVQFKKILKINYLFMKAFIISIGRGNTIVEFFSAEIWVKVCRYLSCKAAPDSEITSEASFKACEQKSRVSWGLTVPMEQIIYLRCFHFTLCCNDFCSGLPSSLRFSRHSSLQRLW